MNSSNGLPAAHAVQLRQRGLHPELQYKLDVMRNASGGIERATRAMGNLDLKLKLEADKLWGWSSTTIYLHLLADQGAGLNGEYVGSAMGVSNIEAPHPTAKFFHAWIQRNFFDNRFSVLAGLYPIDSEFYVTNASAVFLHPSFGMAAEVAASGKAGPSIFNTSALGVRLKFRPNPAYYFQVAVTDGVPGDPSNPKGTHVKFSRGDGAMTIVEAGAKLSELGHLWEPLIPERGLPTTPAEKLEEKYEPISKIALGAWRYTPRFDDLVEVDGAGNPLRRVSRGVYVLAEQSVYREQDDVSQGAAVFVRYGRTDGDVNAFDYSASIGLSYVGLIPGRGTDVFGIAMTRGQSSAKYRQAAGAPLANHESVIEATYRIELAPWLFVQPNLQRISHPGFDPTAKAVTLVGTRLELVF